MAAIFHDIGKPKVRDIGKKDQVTFYGHQQTGAIMLKSRMEALRFSKAEIPYNKTCTGSYEAPDALTAKKVSDKAKANFLSIWVRPGRLVIAFHCRLFSTRANREETEKYLNFLNSLFLFREKMEKQYRKGP